MHKYKASSQDTNKMTDTATLPPQGPESFPYVEDPYTLVPTAEGPESHYSNRWNLYLKPYGPEHPLVDSSYVVTQDHINRQLERMKAALNSNTTKYHVNTAPNTSSNESPQSSNPYISKV